MFAFRLARNTAATLVLAATAFADGAPSGPAWNIEELLGRIRSYEALFEHVHLSAHEEQGTGTAASPERVRSRQELFLDGARRRWELVSSDEGILDARTLQVSDGTQVLEWRHRRGRDEGTIAPQDDTNTTTPLHYAFRRYVNLDGYDERTVTVVSDTDRHITLRFEVQPDRYLLATFERYGEFLRTISYQPYWKTGKTGEWMEGTSFHYEYAPWERPTKELLAPVSFRMVNQARLSASRLVIDHADFDFVVAPETFTLTFPAGCAVDDQIRDQRFEAGAPETTATRR